MAPPVPASPELQCADSVLMVRPACFGFNPETAATNAFQRVPGSPSLAAGQSAALREFETLADQLARAGIVVVIADDTASPVKPDAVFPNNWVSFHGDGTVVLYPMLAPNRRLERRDEVLTAVIEVGGFSALRTVDLSHRESQDKFLEGTGSLVLDRPHRLAYASLSPRTDLDALGEFGQRLGYELVTFEAFDAGGMAIYHTNVLMAVGTRFALVCGEAIGSQSRKAVLDTLRATGHEIIEITRRQMHHFAGNALELRSSLGPVIAVSAAAWGSLDAQQRRALEQHGSVLTADIPVIETLGGGSVRCMLAEIHLPRR